jgi:predicted nucleotidyltransferase
VRGTNDVRSAELFDILRRAAEVSGRTEFVVIGSQAVHGTVRDPDIDAVIRSPDVDLYPKADYTPIVYEELMLQLGQDSDFHVETGHYIEAVSQTLARFPEGWEDRATTMQVGFAHLAAGETPVVVMFPEIHDLAVAKLAIRREKDLEFVYDIVRLGLVEEATFKERFRKA